MDWMLDLVMVLLGFVGSFFSGLLGIGGAIINYPMLLFVPSALNLAEFTGQQVSSISMFQVFFASLAGMLAFQRRKKADPGSGALIHRGLVIYMGSSILVGSLFGGVVSKFLSSAAINVVYGVLAIIAVILMLIPNKGQDLQPQGDMPFNKIIAIVSAFTVGIVSGIVGAGGAFILIPIMLTVLKIPTRTTIASSLAIVFISAVGGIFGKIAAGHIPIMPTMFTVIGSLLGAPLGSRMSARLNVQLLRYALIVLIAATSIKIWFSILG
ncbi:sulfite exporter TauE/SafE family protein [Paenibacillus mendelii]|uniref:Probable membrane transporter protein n=1 Tax=Paenibacillus mendelii TaxID=206163 RepID=A0ABV6JG34_9BACL|nr:sulfite exporter TauE/SafE family protein [Paenibacillus mendelii]MCQ6557764.1 sulfite exporter TauE/SafE family protein [Paenibacillus mendelii]